MADITAASSNQPPDRPQTVEQVADLEDRLAAALGKNATLTEQADSQKKRADAAEAEVAKLREVLEQTGIDRANEVADLEQKWSARFAKLTPVVEAAHARERAELDAAHREQLAALRG